MILNIVSDTITTSLVITSVMIFIVLIIVFLARLARGRRTSHEGDEIYIGGESEEILRHKIPSVLALYWGIVKKAWRKACEILSNTIHTGVLNDWYEYMGIWLGLILFMALTIIIVYLYDLVR